MATKKKIEPIFDKTRDRWRIDVPATAAADGKRYKAWFKTRDLAREHLAGINSSDNPTTAIAPSLAADADKARSILESWNLDLVQAAREVVAALEAMGDAGTILEAAKAYRLAYDTTRASKPLGEAVAAYIEGLEKRVMENSLRSSTFKSYSYTLEKAFLPLHGEIMADIEATDIESVLSPKKATSRRMHTRNLRVFWKWASHSKRGWSTMAPVDALEAVHTSNDADIAILSAADVKALLHAAEAEGAAAAYAIAVFGGVRMAELSRLTWENIGDENIEIGRAISKKHSRRLIPICPALRAWIDAHRGEAADEEKVVPANWVEITKAVRRRAGWSVAARRLNDLVTAGKLAKLPKITRGKWPANGCRHTCASVQVAIGTPLEELTFKFGHSGGHDLLKKHYVSRLTKKDALAILAIGPNGTKIQTMEAVA